MRRPILLAAMLLGTLGLAACGSGGKESADDGPRKLRVTATVGMVGDLVRNVGGDRVEVTTLMGPGVDPHLYKASEGDIARLSRADIVFYNGLLLEGKMAEVLEQVARRGRPTVAVAEAAPEESLLHPESFEGHPDPHLWFDVALWAQFVPGVVEALTAIDPDGGPLYRESGDAFAARLRELDAWCREQLATVPQSQRVLVTAHDAFGYFGRAYDVDVVGLQGLSTASEYGLKDVQRIVEIVTERKVKAVFVESSVPKRSIEAVVAGCRRATTTSPSAESSSRTRWARRARRRGPTSAWFAPT